MKASPARSGFTLIELMTIVGVLSLLTGLLLPAVMSAREAARMASCGNNLRQLGIAIAGYHAEQNCYPIGDSHKAPPGFPDKTQNPGYFGFFSIHCRMLPFLDAAPIFNQVNFTSGTLPAEFATWAPGSNLNAPNLTCIATRVSTLICPTDSKTAGLPACSYRTNVGVGPGFFTNATYQDSDNGFFSQHSTTRAANIVDGLSHTICISERLTGAYTDSSSTGSQGVTLVPQRDYWTNAFPTVSYTADQTLLSCRASAISGVESLGGFSNSGSSWFWASRLYTYYTHTQEPNGRIPDCLTGHLGYGGMSTSRSLHPGSVHALLGDGSTRRVNGGINRATWRALGTRNGGELVD